MEPITLLDTTKVNDTNSDILKYFLIAVVVLILVYFISEHLKNKDND